MPRLTICRLEDRTTPAHIGSLDETFGTAGLAAAAFDAGGGNQDTAAAVAVQPDGKIVVVGTAAVSATDFDFAVARFNTDGTPDATFGSGGQRVVGFDLGGANADRATGVAIDAAGRIVVVGTVQVSATDKDFGVLRLLANGDLDAAFDTDGRATVAFDRGGANRDAAAGVAVNGAGIHVLGTVQVGATDTDFGVARLLDDGTPDAAFGTAGQTTVAFDLGGSQADTAAAILLQPTGEIIAVGTAALGAADTDFAAARLTAAGVLDTSFNGTGTATVAFDKGGTNADTAAAAALDRSGRIVLAGTVTAEAAGDTDVGLARLTAAGVLDTAFGTGGTVVVGFDRGGANADIAAGLVVIDRAGTIAVAATVETAAAGDTDVGVVRLTDAGTLDGGFGEAGRAVIAFDRGGANADTAAGIAALPNGRLVAVATATADGAGDTDFAVARLIGGTELSGKLLATRPNGDTGTFTADTGAFVLAETIDPFPGFEARTAVADLNGDGFDDLIYGVGPGGGSAVQIRFGIDPDLLPVALPAPPTEFDAFEAGFTGGVFVAAADIDGDGRAELAVSPDVGGGGRVQIFAVQPDGGIALVDNFFGIEDPAFRGGCRVAMGDVDGDGRADVIVGAGFLGGPRTAIFDGRGLAQNAAAPPKLVNDFFAFPGVDATRLRNGVYVAAGDVTGDGKADLIFGGGPGGGPRVFVLDGATVASGLFDTAYANPVANFFVAADDTSRGGVRLTVKDVDGDGLADVVAAANRTAPALPTVRVYRGATLPNPNGIEPPVLQTLAYADNPLGGVYVG